MVPVDANEFSSPFNSDNLPSTKRDLSVIVVAEETDYVRTIVGPQDAQLLVPLPSAVVSIILQCFLPPGLLLISDN